MGGKMKKIKVLFIMLMAMVLMPFTVYAKENTSDEDFEVISQTEKYYKTVTNNNIQLLNVSNKVAESYEVTKEEYEASEKSMQTRGAATTETTYKKLTTTILSNGSLYRYKTVLTWKQMPSVRSYDVIGIGHYSSVKYNSSSYFEQTYCLTNGTCRTLTAHYPQYFSTGVSATFKVPEGNFSSLSQTFFYDVTKNVNATIISQAAYGDYSHAVRTVTVSQGKSLTVGTSGIQFTNGVGNYYDDIQPAVATWSGSW